MFKIAVYIINAGLVALILYSMYLENSDKSVVIIIFYYPVLILLNLVTALVLRLFKKNAYKVFLSGALFLVILLMPVIVICSKLNL